MANFFGKDGKHLTDEELEQASGGMVIATNTNIFTQKHWICPKCKGSDFTVDGLYDGKTAVYFKCKKCGEIILRANI